MRISYSWLKEYIELDQSPEELAEILTNIGLEVEGIEQYGTVKGGLEGLLVGEVIEKAKHPNANKLCLTKVNIGNNKDLQIVCGAPNVEVGQRVVVAPVETTIHPVQADPFKIKKVRIRGEMSEGMICSEDEIGLGTDHSGIIVLDKKAKVGSEVKDHYEVERDVVFEIGLTPNRVDAASHIGVARDLAAILSKKIKLPSVDEFEIDGHENPIDIIVEDTKLCPRYSGLTITGIHLEPSPVWLQKKMESIGLKPINNIVDITNFVLQEMGQPLHAFDAKKITNLASGKCGEKVIVKTLKEGTKFITLDEAERKLSREDLMICNEEEGMCIAGVMGGIDSGITEKTKDVFLESAYFNPVSIRKTAKRHSIQSDASFRFERGADPNITLFALKRAALLIKEIAGGKISSDIIDIYPKPVKNFTINLKYSNVDRLIGETLDRNIIKKICSNLGMEIEQDTKDGLKLSVPPAKVDVQREADVIEEILRIYGYNNISIPSKISTSVSSLAKPDRGGLRNTVATYLSNIGYYEIFNNSLVKSAKLEKGDSSAAKVLNPLSADLSSLRENMIYGGMETISYNMNRQTLDLKLYEMGNCYRKSASGYNETEHLALYLTGDVVKERWNATKNKKVNTFYLKGCVENIFQSLGISDYEIVVKKDAGTDNESGINIFAPAETLIYYSNNKQLGVVGRITGDLLDQFDVKQDVYYGDINLSLVWEIIDEQEITFKSIPRFPHVRRDLSLLLNSSVKFQEIEQIAYETEKKLIREINVFDVYEGKQIEKGKKSYSVSFILQDKNRTLTDEEVDKVMEKLISRFKNKLNTEIR
ncbi:phenylalanine--tRNA ligase subunit beta [Candidatus Amoebophilus asiaticus]|nr:phenylalanine--tRNA ligase subunit beta [Candidatus Amoebophilus asiaticus]